jgi:hypothetical protein
MNNPLHQAIFNVFYPLCLENTRLQRIKVEKETPDKESEELIKFIHAEKTRLSVTAVYAEFITRIAGKILGKELHYNKTAPIPNPLTVIYLSDEGSNVEWFDITKPYIVVSGGNRYILDSKWAYNTHSFASNDFRFATDDEVKECVQNLNQHQIKELFKIDAFSPYINTLFLEAETELVSEDELKPEDVRV